MWLIDRIKSAFSVKWFTNNTEGFFYPFTNTSYWVKQLSRSDYLRLYTSWQYVAVSTIANSIAELETTLTRTVNDDKEINHPYRDLITYDMLVDIVSFMQLAWSCYLWKHTLNWKIQSLEILRPDMVEIVEKWDWSLDYYRYEYKGWTIKLYENEVIAFNLFSPMKTYPYTVKWVSPMQAVAIQAEMDNTANKWNWNFFKQWATVGWTLETDKAIDRENKERLVSKWKQEFQWVNNSNKIAVLDNWLKYNQFIVSQKELDFVESRRFTRDEIFAIFKVPKSIVWVADDVNRASALVAENTFYRVCIRPLARLISEKLNEDLFDWIWIFDFVNVVPADNEQLLLDLNAWVITINEYRQERWYQQIKGWDVLKLNPMNLSDEVRFESKQVKNELWEKVVKKFRENIKGTQEWKEKYWHEKIKRTNKYETKWIQEINKVFDMQLRDIEEQVLKWVKVNKPKLNETKYRVMWATVLTPLYKEVMQNEWNEANNLIWVNALFSTWKPEINKYIKENINKLSKELDDYTKEVIANVIKDWNEAWLWARDIADNIAGKFQDFKQSRALKISRTEITRASNEASELAYKEWGIQFKEYLAELDDRTSEICQELNWKVVKIWEDFAKKGETIWGYTLDYENIQHPPSHPNCRSTLIPVIN